MEDVGKPRVLAYLLVLVFLCCFSNVHVLAATQGKIERSSLGTLNVSVHIPNRVRLVAESLNSSQVNGHEQICLSVIDFTRLGGSSFYRVSNSKLGTRLFQLNNRYRQSTTTYPQCREIEAQYSTNSFSNNTNLIVLMLEPE